MHDIEREERHELLDPLRSSAECEQNEFKDQNPVYLSILTPGLKKGLVTLAVINVILLSITISIAIYLRRGIPTERACAVSTSFYCELITYSTRLIRS